MSLTKAENKYARYLYEGMSQLDAYRKAFPQSKKWKDTTVSPKASKLAKEDKIKTRISELQEAMSEKVKESTLMSAEDVLKGIEDIYDRNKEKDSRTALKALELYGKHLKLFTDKVDIHVKEIPEIIIKRGEQCKKK